MKKKKRKWFPKMERTHIMFQKKLEGRIIWCKKTLSVKLEAEEIMKTKI